MRVQSGATGRCCSSSAPQASCDPITSNIYTAAEECEVPATAIKASLGCGNPTALAELKAGETVLDLGSGGGIDVLLSARRVGPNGKAYGLDMTAEMLTLAEEKAPEWPHQCRVPQRGNRERSPSQQFCGRRHLKLRDQSRR